MMDIHIVFSDNRKINGKVQVSKMKCQIRVSKSCVYCTDNVQYVYSCKDALSAMEICLTGGNIYGIKGAIGSGNWALADLILNPYYDDSKCEEISIDDRKVSKSEYLSMICNLNDKAFIENNSAYTVRQCIEKAISESGSSISQDEVKTAFRLSEERYDRLIGNIGLEIFHLMAAIGYIENKRIFVMPFMGVSNVHIIHSMNCIAGYLANAGGIFIVPYDTSLNIDYLFHYVIVMRDTRINKIKMITGFYRWFCTAFEKVKIGIINSFLRRKHK